MRLYVSPHRLSYHCNLHQGSLRFLSKPISAVGSGSKASIIDPKDNDITIKNAKIVVESQEDDEIQTGDLTAGIHLTVKSTRESSWVELGLYDQLVLLPVHSLKGLFTGKQLGKVTFHPWASILIGEMPGWLIFGVGSFIPLMVDKPLGSRNGIDASFSSQKWYMGNGKWEMLRVDVAGVDTQRVFDHVLTNLARSAPPIPGFRRQKGGNSLYVLIRLWPFLCAYILSVYAAQLSFLMELVNPRILTFIVFCMCMGIDPGKTSNVPKSFLLQILGEERVTKFVIQEIITATVSDYVMKENLNVKDKKITTTPAAEELKSLFTPGNEFGFNATLELEKSESEATSSSSSEME
ncbi:hypothetical protein CK203_033074 [Vitis vinifera]|uniref:Uncharacterized protein n=1 Tax=Vitis vinifera TaxID=29760 RepID=A0A438HVX7_VITVI|nr:hypothetical protein CK203_033074 [Vitis vinifera]